MRLRCITSFLATVHILLTLGVLIWLALTYLFTNTYFRPVALAVELNEGDPYMIALQQGGLLAEHLFWPAALLGGSSIIIAILAISLCLVERRGPSVRQDLESATST